MSWPLSLSHGSAARKVFLCSFCTRGDGLHAAADGDLQAVGDDLLGGGGDLVDDALRVAEVVDDDLHTSGRQGEGVCPAESAVGSGDDRDLAGELCGVCCACHGGKSVPARLRDCDSGVIVVPTSDTCGRYVT